MKILITLLLFSIAGQAMAQNKINLPLKKQLDSVMALDQKYRETLTYLEMPTKRDSVAKSSSLTVNEAKQYYWDLQRRIDSSNLVFIEKLFDKVGYPGKTLVGTPTNESAWNLIQHSNRIDRYLSLIKKAAEENELPFNLYAMMLDRQLMNEGKEQVYGTQAMSKKLKSGRVESFIWPIKNPTEVNRLRKDAGFTTTVEENAKRFNIAFRVVTMDEIK
jgi:hypothetical protein